MNNNENNLDKMVSGLAGLALVTLGMKNFKHPSLLTGIAVVTGVYMLYKGIKTFLPEREIGEEYIENTFTTEPESDYI